MSLSGLSGLSGLSALTSDGGGGVPSITNAEKLALPRSTPVGSRYFITDLSPTPAIQELQAPSSAIGGMFVSGAGTTTVVGIYTTRGTFGGKPFYNILGFEDNNFAACVVWRSNEWRILSDAGDRMYYSTENVATPNLVTTWVADTGSSPVPTVASLTEGELVAGFDFENAGTANPVINGTYLVTASAYGMNAYAAVIGGFMINVQLNGSKGAEWAVADFEFDPAYTTAFAAFPWSGTWSDSPGGPAPAPTAYRNNVCAEANWATV